jgi:hypothetical protein
MRTGNFLRRSLTLIVVDLLLVPLARADRTDEGLGTTPPEDERDQDIAIPDAADGKHAYALNSANPAP